MKHGSNAKSATSYILINFEPCKAISARDIEPSPFKTSKIPEKIYLLGKTIHFWNLD